MVGRVASAKTGCKISKKDKPTPTFEQMTFHSLGPGILFKPSFLNELVGTSVAELKISKGVMESIFRR